MANHDCSWTMVFSPKELPVAPLTDGHTIADVIAQAMAGPQVMTTSSRDGWLHGMLLRIWEAFGGRACDVSRL